MHTFTFYILLFHLVLWDEKNPSCPLEVILLSFSSSGYFTEHCPYTLWIQELIFLAFLFFPTTKSRDLYILNLVLTKNSKSLFDLIYILHCPQGHCKMCIVLELLWLRHVMTVTFCIYCKFGVMTKL